MVLFLFVTWEQRKLGEVFDYERPDAYIVKSDKYSDFYSTPVLTANKGFILGYTDEHRVCNRECIIFDDFTLDSKYVTFPFMVKSSALKILTVKSGYYLPFAYKLLQATKIEVLGHARHYIGVVQFTKAYIPNNKEQCKIGGFLEQLDNLITLHQRKEFLSDCYSDIFNAEDKSKKVANAWEQRKFDYFFTERTDRSGDGELISVTINSGIKKFAELNRFDSKPEDMSNYKVVCEGDIAYNSMRMWQGASGYSPYNGILSPAYTVIVPKNGVSSKFFAYVLKRPKMIHLFEINSQGLTKDTWNLKFPAFSQIEATAPMSFDEQDQISTFLEQLDNLITLHQREHSVKKSTKLSKKHLGDKVLFANAWEQRKAETLFISYAEKGYPELPVLSATQDKGMVYRDDTGKNIFHDKSNEIGYKRVQPGQFVIHLRSFQGGFAHSAILGITSPAYTIFGVKEGEKQYDLYWKCVFSSPKFVKRLETVTYGIRDGRNISYDEFLTMDFLVPKYEEQLEIADSLVKIDNLITLHQRGLIKIQGDKNGKKRSFRRIVQRLF